MKIFKLLFTTFLITLAGCRTPSDFNQVLEDMQENLEFGNISIVIQVGDSLKNLKNNNKEVLHIADSLEQIAERIALDFSVTEEQAYKQIEKLIGKVTPEEITAWEEKGWLEWRMIDSEKKYFKRAVSNLMLIKKFHEQKEVRLREIANEPDMIFRLHHTEQVVKSSENQGNPVVPVKMKMTYTITVHSDAVPDGEKISCWLPFPKNDPHRQKEIKLLSTSDPEYAIAPDTAIHSTIYMEAISKKGVPTTFEISYSYTSNAQHFNMPTIKNLPYDKSSGDYQKYTSEQLPHICFTDDIRKLADSITGNDDNPASVVRKIYFWFKENIPWTGALEYSIIPNIPEYVIKNMRGDCGQQDFLFISMLRYKGIPVRWQSGWMVAPNAENLHDWCEVYYEGTGWVPVDISYDLQNSENPLRSEPYDFQRGEVEWKGGNLYFDKWNYNMKIEYLK